MLQQLHGGRALGGIPDETASQEVDPLRAELVLTGQLGRVALGNVVHDGPLVVQVGPWPSASRHLEDDTAERPNVNRAEVTGILTLDHFGRHVHGRACHRLVGLGAGEVLY